ncbi:HLA class I histocompatibility antigen, B-73 alpha chain-like, partial [Pseudonaja textilis]|uniref:HLA class I histocompatibility antigen, B-73 alpha chain-like n=1 Tax=Pseudonaja textilis TaxID=8673 RepID=UPI000EAA9501
PPVGKVNYKAVNERLEILTCQAFGFYPKEIQATWRRDGEIWEQETFHRKVAPNSDGTYYLWLSIEINPMERDRFRCHLEHKGLQEPLDLAFKEERGWLIPVVIVACLLPIAAILFLICLFGRRRGNNHYQEVASCHDQAPSHRGPSPPENETEDEIRSPLLPQSTSEHKASYGLHRSRSDPGASVSPLCRQEKRNAKWKTWHGSQPSASVNPNWQSEDMMKSPYSHNIGIDPTIVSPGKL